MISEWTYHVRNRAGYSVVETLTAIAIIGVLAATALPHLDTRAPGHPHDREPDGGRLSLGAVRAIVTGVHYSVEWTSSSRYQVKRLKKDASGAWVLDTVVKDVMLPATVTRLYTGGTGRVQHARAVGRRAPTACGCSSTIPNSANNVMLAVWPSGQTYEYS